jgi:hypothetical protein
LSSPGDLVLTWIVLFQTKIKLQLGVFLILLIPHRLYLVYMALLALETNLDFGTPSLLLVIILLLLGCALVISILCLTSLRSKKAGWLLAFSSCPFKKFIDHSGLVDLGFAGNPYT